MARVIDGTLVRRAIPEDLPGGDVERQDLENVLLVGGDAVRVDPILLLPLPMLDGTLSGNRLSLDDGRQIDAVVPDNRRRHPGAGQLSLPDDVFSRRPFGRHLAVRG